MLCENCEERKCLKSGKPCKEVEEYLGRNKIRSREWIRPKATSRGTNGYWREIPFSALSLEDRLEMERNSAIEQELGEE